MAATRLPLTSRTAVDGTPLDYRAFVPPGDAHRRPLVLVHGSGRGAARQFRAFLPGAIAQGVPLIAPVFARERFPRYQSLAGVDGPLSAMDALISTLDDVATCLPVSTDRVDLFGFSGGAQFVHRFAMLCPSRVLRGVVAAAGWYTYLDSSRPFPRGVGPGPDSSGRPAAVEAFLRIPLHVLVGERDVERDAGLRTGESIDRRQGPDRLTRALRWMDHLEAAAHLYGLPPSVSFDLLADTGHSFTEAVERGGLVSRTLEFLHPAGTPPDADPPSADPTTGSPS